MSVRSWDQPLSWLVRVPGLQSRTRHTAPNGDRSKKRETTVYFPDTRCLLSVAGVGCLAAGAAWRPRRLGPEVPARRAPDMRAAMQVTQGHGPESCTSTSELVGLHDVCSGGLQPPRTTDRGNRTPLLSARALVPSVVSMMWCWSGQLMDPAADAGEFFQSPHSHHRHTTS